MCLYAYDIWGSTGRWSQDLPRPVARIMPASPSVHWEPLPFLIERYSPPAIRAVWSDQHRFELWLRIEILACEAWATLGRIPASALPKIRQGTFDATKIAEVESLDERSWLAG